MKKLIILLTGAIMISLVACTPTKPKIEAAVPGPETLTSEGGISDKVPDPNAESMEIISVYSQNNEATGLNQAMDAVSELTAEAMVDKLIEYGVLEDGTKVLKFDKGEGEATLDLSKMPETGSSNDLLTLTAVSNTFIENFGLEKLRCLVNGKVYSNGYIKQGDNDYLRYDKNYKKIK